MAREDGSLLSVYKSVLESSWVRWLNINPPPPTKVDKSAIRKCAVCKGAHEAWNNRCPVRKVELSKVKAAYDARQPYHFVPPTKERLPMGRAIIDATPAEAAAMMNETQRGRSSATTARPSSLTQHYHQADRTARASPQRKEEPQRGSTWETGSTARKMRTRTQS
ncbi:hypothetical protein BKA64DRAFT_648510 [Cadophora sp. MPI-SDFR-AT-0126]|nr:hypothetical protein BKA64DRAFT_648510 [Leotiomycetes sp. MPI-SDFR-AT-0126]